MYRQKTSTRLNSKSSSRLPDTYPRRRGLLSWPHPWVCGKGPAYADFSTHSFARGEAGRLNELRLHAIEEKMEAELALGGHRQLIGELASLVNETSTTRALVAS